MTCLKLSALQDTSRTTSLSPQSLDSARSHLQLSHPPAAGSPALESSDSFSLVHLTFTPPVTPDRRRLARTVCQPPVAAHAASAAPSVPAMLVPNRWSPLGYSSSYRPFAPPLGYPKPCVLARSVPYKPPCLPERPLPPPAPKPSFRSANVPPCLDAPATQCKRPAPVPLPVPVTAPISSVRLPSDETASDQCMASLLSQAVTILGREWLSLLSALNTDSDLFTEASQSSNPQALMLRVVQRFAPSTLERYFAEWQLWIGYCRESQLNPACPPPGALPDWLHSRASRQGLALGPVRALTWFGKHAGLPHLLAAVHSPMAKSFLSPTNPSERRESLPLPLSFLVWLERLVLNPATTPADVLFYGAVLTCTWASLRWADALWLPPARLTSLVEKGAIAGVCLRTKTTKRAMPFAFLISGLTGSASASWATRYLSVLRQAVADTLSSQPDRTLDFLPAITSGSPLRPTLSRPLKRDLALPRLLQAIQDFWRSHDPMSPVPSASLYGMHSCKSTLLAWGRQLSLPASLRRIQGHHRLSSAQQSVELYGRDDAIPMLEFQKLVVQHIRSGFRPLQPMSRGASAPLPDFPVTLPPPAQPLPTTLPVPSASADSVVPAPLPVVCASPPVSVGDEASAASVSSPLPSATMPSASPGRPQHAHADADSVDSVSSASADSGPSDAEPCPNAPVPESDLAPPQFLLYNHRSNVLHAALPADPCFLSTVGKRVDGRMLHFRPACGSRAQQLSSSSVVEHRPSGAQPCLRAACFRQLQACSF